MTKKEQIVSIPQRQKVPMIRKLMRMTSNVFGNDTRIANQVNEAKQRSFDAASTSIQLARFIGSHSHINDEVRMAFNTTKARARELEFNSAIVAKYLKVLNTHLVGPDGFRIRVEYGTYGADGAWVQDRVLNESVKNAWNTWKKAKYCDIAGRNDFIAQNRNIVKRWAIDGVALIRFHETKDQFGLALEQVNVDRLDIEKTQTLANGNRVIMGVEVDAYMRHVAYHLKDEVSSGVVIQKAERVTADNMIMLSLNESPSQVVAVSWLAPVLVTIYELGEADKSTLTAINLGAAQMGFLTSTTEDEEVLKLLAESIDEGEQLTFGVKGGQITMLPPNVDLKTWMPAFPMEATINITKRMRGDIAAGLGLNAITLFGDFADASFSGGRLATTDEREYFESLHAHFIRTFMDVVFARWLKSALAKGIKRVDGSGVIDKALLLDITECTKFEGRTWPPIDPKNEVDAYVSLINNGFMTRGQVAAIYGTDYETNIQELGLESKLAQDNGVYIPNVHDPLKAAANAATVAAAEATAAQATKQAAIDHARAELNAMETRAHADKADERILQLVKSQPQPSVHVGSPNVTVAAPVVNVYSASKKKSVSTPVYDEAGLLVRMDTTTEEVIEEDEVQSAPAEAQETPAEAVVEPVVEEVQPEVVEPAVEAEITSNSEVLEVLASVVEELSSVETEGQGTE